MILALTFFPISVSYLSISFAFILSQGCIIIQFVTGTIILLNKPLFISTEAKNL